MAANKQRLPAALLLLSFLTVAAGSTAWTPADFPNPSTNPAACGRAGVARSAICDPDSVISREAADTVEGTIKDIENAVDPYRADGCSRHDTDLPGFQVAVALMDRMQLVGQPPDKAAEDFAGQIFDSWGVGDAACGNGVLLLLSKVDRQVYILAGRHALAATGEGPLRSVIDRMRPLLRQGRYDAALEAGVVDLGLVLAGASLPSEDGSDAAGLAIFTGIFASVIGFVSWKSYKQRREQRRCQSLLDKLKREQATAVRTGRYPAASCPICFEDFARPSAPPLPSEAGGGGSAGEAGSSSQAQEPLLQAKRDGAEGAAGSSSKSGKKGAAAVDTKQPLELPCGHTFCEPCLSAWLNDHTSCPVCRRDMSREEGPPSGKQQQQQQQQTAAAQAPPAELYQQELLFRMNGLHRLYPAYVTTDMVAHAAAAAERREQLDWDAVRQAQLAGQAQARHAEMGSSGASHGFGGGSHAGGGGVGGSW